MSHAAWLRRFPAAISMDEQKLLVPYRNASRSRGSRRIFHRLFGLTARTGGVWPRNAVDDALLAVRSCTYRKDEPYSPPTRLPARLLRARAYADLRNGIPSTCKSNARCRGVEGVPQDARSVRIRGGAVFMRDGGPPNSTSSYLIQASAAYRTVPGPLRGRRPRCQAGSPSSPVGAATRSFSYRPTRSWMLTRFIRAAIAGGGSPRSLAASGMVDRRRVWRPWQYHHGNWWRW